MSRAGLVNFRPAQLYRAARILGDKKTMLDRTADIAVTEDGMLRHAMTHMAEFMLVVTGDGEIREAAGRLLSQNSPGAVVRWRGKTLSELTFLKTADLRSLRRLLRAAQAGACASQEIELNEIAEPKTVEVTVRPLDNDDASDLYLISGRDVSVTRRHVEAQESRALDAEHRNDQVALALDSAQIGLWEYDIAEDRMFLDERTRQIFGVGPVNDLSVDKFYSAVHHDDHAATEAIISKAINCGDASTRFKCGFRIVRTGGVIRHVELSGLVLFHRQRGTPRPMRVVGTVLDVTPMVEAEQALHRADERLELALSAAQMGVWSYEVASDEVSWSEQQYEVWGRLDHPRDRLSFADVMSFIHEDDVADVTQNVDRTLTSKDGLYEHNFRIVTQEGTVRWLHGLGRVIVGKDGKPVRMLGINYDITDRVEAEEGRELLLRELNHRVKNTLALVRSIAQLSGRSSADVPAFLQSFSRRLEALSSAQDALIYGAAGGASLQSIVERTWPDMSADDMEPISVEMEPIIADPQTAQTLAILLHELWNNALRHGALAHHGTVALKISKQRLNGRDAALIAWRESSCLRIERPPERTGFGLTIISRAARLQGGEAVLDWRRDGLDCRIVLPIRFAEESQAA